MKKRKHIRKNIPHKKRSIIHYLRIYTIAAVAGVVVFAAGTIFIKPTPCANTKSCTADLQQKIENNAVGMFQGHKVTPPKIDLAAISSQNVLGATTSQGEKHIYVDLSSQILYAYEGSTKVMQTYIASGKWGKTPVGNFHIWEKLVATRMSGGEGADAYDLPNVPYVMYFYNDFGLHGAYWHDNFGHPMSHGCVNMRQIDAKALFNWADGPSGNTPGTAVSVCNHFTAPNICQQDNPIN
ncbi:MAG TPA: L,D-transpeptidase [Patescibacteria group bacterium]